MEVLFSLVYHEALNLLLQNKKKQNKQTNKQTSKNKNKIYKTICIGIFVSHLTLQNNDYNDIHFSAIVRSYFVLVMFYLLLFNIPLYCLF